MTPTQNNTEQGNEVSILEIFIALKRGIRLIALAPLVAGLLALAGSYLITPTFTATAKLLTPQQQSATSALLGSLSGLAAATTGLKNPSDQWVGLLKSRTVADKLIERFKLQEYYENRFLFETRQQLEEQTKISAGKDSLIDIQVTDKSPKLAADLANAYIEELQKLSKTLAVSEASQRRLYFERQLIEAKKNLVGAETALQASGISASVLKTSPEAALNAIADLKARVAATEVRLTVLQDSMTPNSPSVKQVTAELSSLRRQLKNVEASDTHRPGRGDSYIEKYREFKYYETLFEMIARQYELAKADEAKDGALIQVVDPAAVPEWKSAPKRGTIAILATALTLLLSIIYILIQPALKQLKNGTPR